MYWFVMVGARASIPGTGCNIEAGEDADPEPEPVAESEGVYGFVWGDGTPMTLPYAWRSDRTTQVSQKDVISTSCA